MATALTAARSIPGAQAAAPNAISGSQEPGSQRERANSGSMAGDEHMDPGTPHSIEPEAQQLWSHLEETCSGSRFSTVFGLQ